MIRMRLRSLYVATTLGGVLLISGSARAALRPGQLPLTDGRPKGFTTFGEMPFECGTVRTGETDHTWRRAVDLRVQRDVKSGARVRKAGLDYVYNNVWIIENDGTLALSGTNAFDTDGQTHRYTPTGGGVYDVAQVSFSFDAVQGTDIFPGDDGVVLQSLGFSFPYGGSTWTDVYVSGNGAVSFGAQINPAGYYDSADFFSATPKIAPLYLDLFSPGGGFIRVKSEATKCTITWDTVIEYGTGKYNSFQLVLYPSGIFTISYDAIGSTTQSNGLPVIIGHNPGGSPTLEEIDFSSDLPFTSIANAAVYEQYFSYTNPLVNEVALLNRFYSQFPDEFFQLVFFTNFTQTMGGFANELNIKNDVSGIGLGIFDGSAQYGSAGVLESRCNMNNIDVWPSPDPAARQLGKGNNFLTIMGQEAGHRWGAFMYFEDSMGNPSNMILGRSDAHWSYYVDVDHSSLEGGNWESTGANNYVCPTNINYFSEIDEYTFGLRTPEEVKDFYYISSAANDLANNRSVGTPLINATCSGTKIPVTIADVQGFQGPRTPLEPAENKDLRQGFVLLVQTGTVPTQAELDKVSGYRAAWEDYFEKSCDGRLTCNTSLTQNFPVAAICGHVRNSMTTALVTDFTANSVERGFSQHVPKGGRYTFRYQKSPTSGANEPVTIIFNAIGFVPDTLTTNLAYGATTCIDVDMNPTQNAVAITSFDATSRDGAVELRAAFRSDLGVEAVTVYRGDADREALARLETLRAVGAESFEYIDRTVVPGRAYRYQIGVTDADGEFLSPPVTVSVSPIVASLAQNQPNPFNPTTTIRYTLSEQQSAALTIHDVNGRLVRTLVDEVQSHGQHEATWDGRDDRGQGVSSGVYFYRLQAGKLTMTRKMVLLK